MLTSALCPFSCQIQASIKQSNLALIEGLLLVRLCDVENNYLVWKHHPFHGENPMKVRRASTQYLSFPSAPKCCKHMAIATVYLSAQFKNALQSVVVRGGLFSSMVND